MDGTAELRRLAHLLRTGADVVIHIAAVRPDDEPDLMKQVGLALGIAAELERIADHRPKISIPDLF